MGQTDTDGEKTPTGSESDDTQGRFAENMDVCGHVHVPEVVIVRILTTLNIFF